MRKGSKVKVNKVKSKRTCTAIFVVFLKCTLERRLEGFQQVELICTGGDQPKSRIQIFQQGQPSIIKSLEQKFGKKAMKTRSSLTPGTPRFIARRLENEEDKVNAQDHETYRSGVGTLLYLTKHSRPDISNPVRELSKTMDAPAPAHLKEMYKLIRFVLETKDHGLKFKLMKSIRKWVLKAISDSDFASDKETRISIFGYVIYFCGIPIAWRSKGMKSVVLT